MDVSDIFYFFCSGRGKGESSARRGRGWFFLLKIRGGGGGGVSIPERGRGFPGGLFGANLGIWGGGGGWLNIFCSGPKRPPRNCLD